jgi:hypothetical protein
MQSACATHFDQAHHNSPATQFGSGGEMCFKAGAAGVLIMDEKGSGYDFANLFDKKVYVLILAGFFSLSKLPELPALPELIGNYVS